ncbi:GNAT family N-acetyltransferase [Streptomyces sp. BR123]|uniref:GNAT family N-acetyltransferase n=1 Tax=Streptomyces sp. BR123 TaxID=2749828 RepID=UPI0028112A9D|nr:GNAT family N-acetyltransferase [Streptomyces sp. BR123]
MWGHGCATEAARACPAFGFEALGLPEAVASTTADGHRSRAVMRRIGTTRDRLTTSRTRACPKPPPLLCAVPDPGSDADAPHRAA